jgi:two-component system invasion response regulator UvrY
MIDLTDREKAILVLIARGKTVAEIADQLALSHKSIHALHDRILQKLNVKNDVQLTWRAIREGWVTLESATF